MNRWQNFVFVALSFLSLSFSCILTRSLSYFRTFFFSFTYLLFHSIRSYINKINSNNVKRVPTVFSKYNYNMISLSINNYRNIFILSLLNQLFGSYHLCLFHSENLIYNHSYNHSAFFNINALSLLLKQNW